MARRMNRSPLTLLVALVGALGILASKSPEKSKKCCFTHPNYSGTCEVAPGEGETCQSILEYLNTPMTQGKTYCGGTALRGGWKLESCGEPSSISVTHRAARREDGSFP